MCEFVYWIFLQNEIYATQIIIECAAISVAEGDGGRQTTHTHRERKNRKRYSLK